MATPRALYSLTPTDAVHGAFPHWVNRPRRSETNPHMPRGPWPDPGSDADGIGSGFPEGMARPILEFERMLQEQEYLDIILSGNPEWTLSDRAKSVFEAVDPEAFEFCETTTRFRDGSEAPRYWLCEVVRFLDAVDEERSDVYVQTITGFTTGRPVRRVSHGIAGRDVFRASVVRGHHVFRALYAPMTVFVDDVLVTAIAEAKLVGMIPLIAGTLDDS